MACYIGPMRFLAYFAHHPHSTTAYKPTLAALVAVPATTLAGFGLLANGLLVSRCNAAALLFLVSSLGFLRISIPFSAHGSFGGSGFYAEPSGAA